MRERKKYTRQKRVRERSQKTCDCISHMATCFLRQHHSSFAGRFDVMLAMPPSPTQLCVLPIQMHGWSISQVEHWSNFKGMPLFRCRISGGSGKTNYVFILGVEFGEN